MIVHQVGFGRLALLKLSSSDRIGSLNTEDVFSIAVSTPELPSASRDSSARLKTAVEGSGPERNRLLFGLDPFFSFPESLSADLPGCRLREFVDEREFARVLVLREAVFHELLKFRP